MNENTVVHNTIIEKCASENSFAENNVTLVILNDGPIEGMLYAVILNDAPIESM